MNETGNRKTTGALRLKQTGALKRRFPDLAETFEKEPLAKIEAPIWREIRIMLAAKLYGADRLSSERAAKLAGPRHVKFLPNTSYLLPHPAIPGELRVLRRKKTKEAPISGLLSVGGIGLEPTTSAMSKQCSNQLSYPPDSEGIL